MAASRLVLRLLAGVDPSGARDALIGDVLEEIAHGRSRIWVCQQLIGLYACALATSLRRRARLTPHVIAFALGLVLLGGMSVASVSTVLETWLGVYLVTGTMSLFAHMAARTVDSRRPVISTETGSGV